MSTKTPDLTKLDADALAAELNRRESETQRDQAERAERLEVARHEWAADTWAKREQLEADLQDQGRAAREAFSAAVKAADLPGAFEAWMAERQARYTREALRNRAAGAGRVLGDPQADHLADVRWYSPDFLARLEEEADKHARANGYDQVDELAPPMPTEA